MEKKWKKFKVNGRDVLGWRIQEIAEQIHNKTDDDNNEVNLLLWRSRNSQVSQAFQLLLQQFCCCCNLLSLHSKQAPTTTCCCCLWLTQSTHAVNSRLLLFVMQFHSALLN
jgi:hypothetical protein